MAGLGVDQENWICGTEEVDSDAVSDPTNESAAGEAQTYGYQCIIL